MGTKSPDNMNFLIVDDADNMRRSIRAMLKLINTGEIISRPPMVWLPGSSSERASCRWISSSLRPPNTKSTAT
jgi:hypothetical protein